MKKNINILLLFIFFHSGLAFGQKEYVPQPLFESDDILEIKITLNVNEVIKDIEVRDAHEATLSYTNSAGEEELFKVKLTVRGNSRTNTKVCRFPPLRINFKKKKVANTVFAGQNKVKLVTHCNSRSINEEYILREYYVYKLHNLVTPYSFKVRLCRIVYEDIAGKFEPEPHYGFLIEDIDDVAKRNGLKEYNDTVPNQEVCDRVELDRLMIFQYLIGNLDWSVSRPHNFKLIVGKAHPFPIAIPYDFDYAGIINTSYAQVPESIDIATVRTRVFRGLCRLDGGYDDALNHFRGLKESMYNLYGESQHLSDKSKNSTLKYFDSFYKVLDNPRLLKQNITQVCRAKHTHLYDN